MKIIRLLLQLALALLFVAGLLMAFSDSKNNEGGFVLIVISAALIALLGPFWPNQRNLTKWAEKSNFRLPTDDPKVALLVANVLVALYAFYQICRVLFAPPSTDELWRLEKVAYSLAGLSGVGVFWFIIGTVALATALRAYKKSPD